jgi:hypothetical protein
LVFGQVDDYGQKRVRKHRHPESIVGYGTESGSRVAGCTQPDVVLERDTPLIDHCTW